MEPFTVAVASDGRLILKGREATEAAVISAVRTEIAERGDGIEVVVSADGSARHERFVALLDLLRSEGVTRFAIQTEGEEAGG